MALANVKTVNRPIDPKQKEQDINNKLQLYGIFTAFTNGKAPSNKQIDVALNSFLASRALSSPSTKLSPEGQKLVADMKDVIEKAKILLLTKNEGNLLQDFIWQTQHVTSGEASVPGAPVDKGTAKQHGSEALEGIRTLGSLIISNGQFRKLLKDATVLFRDMAGDAAQSAANRINPSEDELNDIDRPAPDDTWHDVPDVKGQLKQRYQEQKPFGRSEMKQAMGNATQAGNPGESRDPADAADLAVRDYREGGSGGNAQEGLRAGVDTLRGHASENIPDETKDKAKDKAHHARESGQEYINKKIPQERRDQAIFRLKKMITEIQGHRDYQTAVDTLLRLAVEYSGHTKNLTQQAQGTVKGAHTDTSLRTAEADLKTLIERFANSTSLDDIVDSINGIYRDADNDPELKGWFKDVDAYIRRALKEQGYVLQDRATDEWNQLYDRGHDLLRSKYRGHTDRIVDEFKFIGEQFDHDEQNRAFGASLQKLFTDLGNDKNGKPTFKPHLIKDLTDVIIPAVFENTRYIPVPRIEYSDPMIDVVVENLIIESDNLAPNVFEFASDNYWRWGRKQIANKHKHKVMANVSGIQMDLKDISYYVRRKQGFPAIKDTGLMDVFLGGSGFSFKIHMETADEKDSEHYFKVNKVDVDIKHMKIKLKKSKFKFIFALVKPLLLFVIRPALQKVLEKQIKTNVHQLDEIAWKMHQEVERAKTEAMRNPDPSNVQNIYQRYVTAAQNNFLQKKRKAEDVAQDKKVNVAVTQQDSIFKDVALPGGISTKATEYKNLARKGDKWESPVFSIGSAKATSTLPTVTPVSRKPHDTRAGRIDNRGASNPVDIVNKYANGSSTGNSGYPNGQAYGTTPSNQAYVGGVPQANPATAGFSNQVNEAFGTGTGDNYKLGSNAPQTGVAPIAGTSTTLGSHNPVLTGAV